MGTELEGTDPEGTLFLVDGSGPDPGVSDWALEQQGVKAEVTITFDIRLPSSKQRAVFKTMTALTDQQWLDQVDLEAASDDPVGFMVNRRLTWPKVTATIKEEGGDESPELQDSQEARTGR